MVFRAAPPQFEALTGSPGRFTFCLTLPSRKIIAGGLLVGLVRPQPVCWKKPPPCRLLYRRWWCRP